MTVTSVTVGVDGSSASDEALIWALGEGRLRTVPVRAVHAWQPSGSPPQVERLSRLQSVTDLRAQLLQEVTSGVRAVAERARATDVTLSPEVVYGHPVEELVRAAGSGSLLVVGSRGRGSVAGSVLGSVSQSCAQQADGIVVVVRGRRPDPRAGRVVVGVDGSPQSQRALRFAERAARLRGASLRVVHAWTVPALGYAGRVGTWPQEAYEDLAVQAAEVLQASLRRGAVDAAHPRLEVRLVEEAPASALLQAAEDADLLVVGSRGYGGWKGLLLGSVSTRCLTQSPCPVAVVRVDQDGSGRLHPAGVDDDVDA